MYFIKVTVRKAFEEELVLINMDHVACVKNDEYKTGSIITFDDGSSIKVADSMGGLVEKITTERSI